MENLVLLSAASRVFKKLANQPCIDSTWSHATVRYTNTDTQVLLSTASLARQGLRMIDKV